MYSIVKLLILIFFYPCSNESLPLVINTWGFIDANIIAWKVLNNGGSVLDAVEAGCTKCEEIQCDGTVGFGGSPDETGETTLDAMIMDGKTMNAGAVGSLRNVKSAVSVARYVMEHTTHTMLVGSQASRFAIEMGFAKESLTTNVSRGIWNDWRANHCQPNYWINVTPDPTTSCGPYKPMKLSPEPKKIHNEKCYISHDTIGMVAVDVMGNVAVATSTNGARHKIPGRVGDSPIIGSGGYADNDVGGAAATGDGDILMRFLPSFKAVEDLKSGKSPQEAATNAIQNIVKHNFKFMGAIVVADKYGNFSAACYGLDEFPLSVSNRNQLTAIFKVECLK